MTARRVPAEPFFAGWKIEHDLAGNWRAECPGRGVRVGAKTLLGLIAKMARAKPPAETS